MFLCLALALNGCVTAGHQLKYKYVLEGKEYKNLKELNDDQALEMGALIYNARVETSAEKAAKNLTIERYLDDLRKRRSKKIKESGILELEYEEVDLKGWKREELVGMFESLKAQIDYSASQPSENTTERENARMIIHATGINSIVSELKRRQDTETFWQVFSQVLVIAANVALSLI